MENNVEFNCPREDLLDELDCTVKGIMLLAGHLETRKHAMERALAEAKQTPCEEITPELIAIAQAAINTAGKLETQSHAFAENLRLLYKIFSA